MLNLLSANRRRSLNGRNGSGTSARSSLRNVPLSLCTPRRHSPAPRVGWLGPRSTVGQMSGRTERARRSAKGSTGVCSLARSISEGHHGSELPWTQIDAGLCRELFEGCEEFQLRGSGVRDSGGDLERAGCRFVALRLTVAKRRAYRGEG